eukprot:CAMPEP_0171330344 /NCGR_PEP_ID=MMETSP0878-20121228/1943_1 /TAXON_ID=67004 /ORGANISM="Thalassiosira weissflogii, Strain CCMP1336" /LENGTH=35 /DNA_ID= /DNA_START= /DNA_END= /DNA_ORIENTATION=
MAESCPSSNDSERQEAVSPLKQYHLIGSRTVTMNK